MNVKFLIEAQSELDETIKYYNQELPGLGENFLTEVLSTIDRIVEFPNAWHQLSDEIRRCHTRRFPYGLIYTIIENEVLYYRYLTYTVNQITGKIE
ncbi:MAG: type II toxin-antitoxin system RelE/ParE family toxin [Candidatus Dadabacteria bacterium]|nr:type II toxin-antitoxin system RelE/ParE family toxin [Candidatus Dadabacteria bacterium]NIS07804.1 type II toxin-antitoxin system RelE/ParE family toxin [Candidatus Dadabacteria bacterium]NIV43024.1 type II toxin-antitoxin system RelE/ParE family toxin [Candidatus Dadabacteria bacterium]NIY21422.1 type II toxin-antitoxin system RelE/ParE family toxin [Candidatus Dadabacteria bacterium]